MSEKNMSFEKSLSLADLSGEVCTCEAEIGPLKRLDHTDDVTIAVYRRGMSPRTTVDLMLGANNAPDGYTKVCDGQVWILNQKQMVTAVRKND